MAPNNSTQHAGPYPPRHSSMQHQRSHESTSAGEGMGVGEGSSYPHGVVASHYLAQQLPNARDGETWMDFLADPNARSRSAANSPPPPPPHPSSSRYTLPTRLSSRTESSSRSSDRKRRLTTADSPMRRPSSIRMHSNNQGATVTDPIIIDSPPAATMRALPPPPPFSPQTPTEPARRESDIVLPPWQPDAEVSQCPVCDKKFTFYFRKHHCRKCGRVVCASCSPHRITIPRQFIVHPPSDGTSTIVDLTNDDENSLSPFGPFRNPALGGGEEVRVCNPCVPDPNYGPPPQYNPGAASRHPSQSSTTSTTSRPYIPPGLPQHPRAHRSSSNAQDSSRNAGHGQTHRTHYSGSDSRRVSYHGGLASGERQLPPLPGHAQTSHVRPSVNSSSISRYTTPSSGHIPFNLPSSRSGLTTGTPPTMPLPTRPRRQIAEEDECPICGHELPPKGPEDDETDRTQHIEECIALHSGSPAPAPLTHTTSASLPAQRSRGMSNAGEGASNRMSHAARGMFPFTATEKDCLDADGGAEECVICMEDYEAGEKMARLPCWCKFHEVCIKKWWVQKGRGACPTHQLHE